jgi:CCR4-NOT transcription complex subunit 6
MSAEDVAAGRKSSWQGVEITGDFRILNTKFSTNSDNLYQGNVRNISPQLWQFEHLTALYLNDNCLSRLPSDIGLLVNLRTLDLSNNKLRSLPAELGELIQLRWENETTSTISVTNDMKSSRELHLSHNMLRNLPYELGKLFHLVVLGLHGNPLTKDILSIYNDMNGTNKLLTHMLDNYSREYRKNFFLLFTWY